MSLTKDQQNGAKAFFDFLLSDDEVFILSGEAGTGKTFLMKKLKDEMAKRYIEACKLLGLPIKYDTVTFTATTNKAAEVLEQTIHEPVQTIHSFLHLTVKENNKTGKTYLERTSRYKTHSNKIIFIDEASMIDSALLQEIYEATTDCKLIFIGDHAQMAPVNEELSPIFKNVKTQNSVFLTEPIRNADSPALKDLCRQLRKTVETGIFHPIQEVPGSVEHLSARQMQDKIADTFTAETDSARILCYTNSRVVDYNDHIRELRGKSAMFEPGDILVVAQSYAQGSVSLPVERQVLVHDVANQISAYATEAGAVQFYTAEISLLTSTSTVSVAIPQNPKQLKTVLNSLARKKNWQEYFMLKNSMIDLRGREACTVYKSQGSTYETVFMDIGNIGTSRDAKQVARMLFVGASRATTKLYLFGDLPSWYTQTDRELSHESITS